MSNGYSTLELRRSGPVLTLLFNRPDRLNAIDARMHTELARVFAEIARDAEARAVVVTGAGRAFCAGGDIDWFQDITAAEADLLFTEEVRAGLSSELLAQSEDAGEHAVKGRERPVHVFTLRRPPA